MYQNEATMVSSDGNSPDVKERLKHGENKINYSLQQTIRLKWQNLIVLPPKARKRNGNIL